MIKGLRREGKKRSGREKQKYARKIERTSLANAGPFLLFALFLLCVAGLRLLEFFDESSLFRREAGGDADVDRDIVVATVIALVELRNAFVG